MNTDDMRDRREMLSLLSMAGGMMAAVAPSAAQAASTINFADPVQKLDAFIKVEGDTAGKQVVQYGAGSIYTFIEGQKDRKLFDTEAFAVRRYERTAGG